MRHRSSLRSSVIPLLLVSTVFVSWASAAAITLSVAAPGPQTFVEQTTNPLTFVTFTVTNNDATKNYILDYALEIITLPADRDDQVWNNGNVTASTFILAATPANILAGTNVGTYTFGVFNPFGDTSDCCDPGVNPINFFIEMSPMLTMPTAANIATNAGYGQFIFPIGGSSTGTENGAQLTNLMNCFNTPATCPAAVAAGPLFTNGIQGFPSPATTSVTVLDTPEPATAWILALGFALIAFRYVSRRVRYIDR